MCEVYYDDTGAAWSCSDEPIMFAESLEDLTENINAAVFALGKDIVDYEDLAGSLQDIPYME